MKKSVRLGQVDNKLYAIIDNNAVAKPISSFSFTQETGGLARLTIQMDLTEELSATADEIFGDLSPNTKAIFAIEALQDITVTELEEMISRVSGNIGPGLIEQICLMLERKYLGRVEDAAQPELDFRDPRFNTFA